MFVLRELYCVKSQNFDCDLYCFCNTSKMIGMYDPTPYVLLHFFTFVSYVHFQWECRTKKMFFATCCR